MTGLPFGSRQRLFLILTAGAATAILCRTDLARWFGSWGETGATLEYSTTLTYPFVAAFSAWLSSAPKRRRFAYLLRTSARSPRELYVRAALWISGSASAGFLSVAAVVYVTTGTEATYGRPSFLALLTIASGYVAFAGVGLLAGILLPGYAAPVAAMVLVYGFEFFTNNGNPDLAPLVGLAVADGRDRTYFRAVDWVLLARAGWLLAVGYLAIVLATRRPTVWLAPLAVVCGLAAPLLLVGETGIVRDHGASRLECSSPDAAVSLCLTAARAHASDEVWEAMRPELKLVRGLDPGGIRLTEEGFTPAAPTTRIVNGVLQVPFTIPNGTVGDAHKVDDVELQLDLAARLLTWNCGPVGSPAVSSKPEARANDVLMLWLLNSLHLPTDGGPGFGGQAVGEDVLDYTKVRAFRATWEGATGAERTAWLTREREDVIACDVPASHLALG